MQRSNAIVCGAKLYNLKRVEFSSTFVSSNFKSKQYFIIGELTI